MAAIKLNSASSSVALRIGANGPQQGILLQPKTSFAALRSSLPSNPDHPGHQPRHSPSIAFVLRKAHHQTTFFILRLCVEQEPKPDRHQQRPRTAPPERPTNRQQNHARVQRMPDPCVDSMLHQLPRRERSRISRSIPSECDGSRHPDPKNLIRFGTKSNHPELTRIRSNTVPFGRLMGRKVSQTSATMV